MTHRSRKETLRRSPSRPSNPQNERSPDGLNDKVGVTFVELGELPLKGFAHPVRLLEALPSGNV
jgi:hypothetical protein